MRFIFLLFFAFSISYPQNNKIVDSLLNKISVSDDTTKINLYIKIIRQVNHSDPNLGLKYCEEALKLSYNINDKQWQVKVLVADGITEYFLGNYVKALMIFKNALSIAKEIKYKKISNILNNLGSLYLRFSNYPEAIKHYYEALKIAESSGIELNKAFPLVNIGQVFTKQGEYKKALDNSMQALDLFLKNKDYDNIALSFNQIGDIYLLLNDNKQAFNNFNEALKIGKDRDIKRQVIVALNGIGNLYFKQKYYNSALKSYFESLKLIEESNIINAYIYLLNDISNCYRELKQYDIAIEYANRTIEKSKALIDNEALYDAYHILSLIYSEQGDFKKAYEYQSLEAKTRELVINENKTKLAAELQIKYETDKNELTIKYQEGQLNNQRWLLHIISGAVILSMGLALLLFKLNRDKRKVNKLLEEQKNEVIKYTVRLNEVISTKDTFFSIIAHDLKNPFQSIIGSMELIKTQDNTIKAEDRNKLIESVLLTSKSTHSLLENLLQWSMNQMGRIGYNPEPVELRKSVDECVNVLQTAAIDKLIKIENKVDETVLVNADKNMIKTVIRNLVNNALKFTRQNGLIEIDSHYTDENKVKISVRDNGIGIAKDNIEKLFRIDMAFKSRGTNREKGSGLGLALCKDFVEKNGGSIWVESKLDIGSTFYFTLNRD